jgi:hypothetical protein
VVNGFTEVRGPVGLFGSRADDSARGGDLDLLVESAVQVTHSVRLMTSISARLEMELGERRARRRAFARGGSLDKARRDRSSQRVDGSNDHTARASLCKAQLAFCGDARGTPRAPYPDFRRLRSPTDNTVVCTFHPP